MPPVGGATEDSLASVNEVEILAIDNESSTVEISVSGDLSDACTEIKDITKSQAGTTFTVKITTIRPEDVLCAQVITPFEEVIDLDTTGLEPGIYTVDVNGVTKAFTLK